MLHLRKLIWFTWKGTPETEEIPILETITIIIIIIILLFYY